jgi:peptide/nickel transport system permease protein
MISHESAKTRTAAMVEVQQGANPDPEAVLRPKQKSTIRRLFSNKTTLAATLVLVGYLLLGLFGPLVLQDGLKNNPRERLKGPSWEYPLGTDWLGRDQLSRLALGIQTTMIIALGSTAIPLVLGASAGLLAGLSGRWVDSIAMRMVDVLFAFPALLIAMTVVAMLGPGMLNVMIAIGILFLPHMMRTARSPVLALKEADFVMVGRSYGASTWRLLVHHILPNSLPPIIVVTALILSRVIIVEATLSFLGLGAQPPTPTLGGMITGSRSYMMFAPWLAIFPGLAIAGMVFCINLIGDGLQAILDPRQKR